MPFRIPTERPIKIENEDTLARAEFAEKISEQLTNAEPAVMIGLYAPWGSGKTSVLNLVQHQLSEKNNVVTVYFGAWEHENPSGLIPALISSIGDATDDIPNKTDEEKNALKKIWYEVALKIGVWGMGVWTEASELLEALLMLRSTPQNLDNPDDNPRTNQNAHLELKNTLKQALQQTYDSGIERIVLLIDDLDRCHPDNVFSFLDNIRRLLILVETMLDEDDVQCGFVGLLAADESIVRTAIARKYPELHTDASDYLHKLLSVTLRLNHPTEEQLEKLISKRIRQYIEQPNASAQEWEAWLHQTSKRLAKLCVSCQGLLTPRQILTVSRHLCLWANGQMEKGEFNTQQHLVSKSALALSILAVVSPEQYREILRFPSTTGFYLTGKIIEYLNGRDIEKDYKEKMHHSPDGIWQRFELQPLLENITKCEGANDNFQRENIWNNLCDLSREIAGFQ